MQTSWLVLVPTLMVIVLSAITHRILFALVMGIISAALVATSFNVGPAASLIYTRLWEIADLSKLTSWASFMTCGNLFLFGFFILLGVLITTIHHSGAAFAYERFVMKRVKTARAAESSSLFLSMLFFIDDYFSGLLTGAVVQPITDRFKVPQTKKTLLVNTVAAPLVVLVPFSSWVVNIIGQLRNAGVATVTRPTTVILAEPLYFYIKAIPFMFYAIIIVFSAWYLVVRRLGYGLIARHELFAKKTGELFGGKIPVVRRGGDTYQGKHDAGASMFDFMVPVGLLLVTIFGWILYAGQWWGLGGSNTFFQVLQTVNIYAAFFFGCAITVLISFIYFRLRYIFFMRDFFTLIKDGFLLMGDSVIMILLIWTLSAMISDDLGTGNYLAELCIGRVAITWLPLMFFAIAATISLLIGTAWGTIGILVPLAMGMVPVFFDMTSPIVLEQAPILLPLLAAVITGSMTGNHFSPIADVMFMSSASAGAYHLDLVKSQASFAAPALVSAAVSFACVGIFVERYGTIIAALGALGIGLLLNIIFLHVLTWAWRRWGKKTITPRRTG